LADDALVRTTTLLGRRITAPITIAQHG